MEQSPSDVPVGAHSNSIPEDCMTVGELAGVLGIYTETPEFESDVNASSTSDERLTGQSGNEHGPQRRPSGTRVVRAMAVLGIDGTFGRTPDGRVASYVTPQEANRLYDHFFPDLGANQQPEAE